MATEFTAVTCIWCRHVSASVDVCPNCGLHQRPAGQVSEVTASAKMSRRNRVKSAAGVELDLTPIGRPVLGIDPGARYVGMCVRDGHAVLWAETFTADNSDLTNWILAVLQRIREVREITSPIAMGVESITDPKGFKNGKASPINPGFVARTGAVFGAVVGSWPDVIPVKPGGNGSGHVSRYPAVLVGRRPADLPGASWGVSTRAHEQSAYDVAGTAAKALTPKLEIDLRRLVAMQ